MSPRILFAQELGGGFGHVNTLLAVAGRLGGHVPSFALPQPGLTGPAVAAALGPAVPVMPCRPWPSRNTAGRPATMADILFDLGFDDSALLAAAVRDWEAIVAKTAPDLVVGDFAPALRLVTAGRIPTVVVGGGFWTPPPMAPLPALRPCSREEWEASLRHEDAVLAAVNAVQARAGRPRVSRVADLFQGDRTIVTTFPILDPYRASRATPPLSPIDIPRVAMGGPVEQRTGAHVFCYLDAGSPAINPVLTALNRLGRRTEVYVRGLAPEEVARHCAPHVGVHVGPAELGQVAPGARLLIHHGGIGTTAIGLLAGTPQLLLPQHVEQELNAAAIASLDCSVALAVAADADPAALQDLMAQLLSHRAMQANALSQARSMQAESRGDALDAVASACSNLLMTGAISRSR